LAAKGVLRNVLHDCHAEWTCEEQKRAVLEVLQLKHDVLVILRTGAGKTMLPIIASQLERGNKVTAVVLPLKSLVNDYTRRLKDMGIGYELFQGQHTKQLTGAHGLVLVSADMAKQSHWKQCLVELNERQPVARLIFDEGHFAVTGSDYRSALRNLYDLQTIPMQLVVLSATIPPTFEGPICDAFGLEPDTVVICTPSDRPELEYILQPCQKSSQEVVERTKRIIAKHE
jgi:superfamily II DNA helicase RecQ